MLRKTNLLVLFIVMLLVMGCMGQGAKVTPISEMTPEQKATMMMSMYNTQADNYKSMAARPNLIEEQKVILRKKKVIMDKVYPLISLYKSYVKGGAVPPADKEKQIFELLDELTLMILAD